MSLLDESAAAFAELIAVIDGSTITFNGISKPCVAATLNIKRVQQISGYQVDGTTQITMLASDYATFVGIVDRVSKLQINGGTDLVIIGVDTHPNSAVVHLFLTPPG